MHLELLTNLQITWLTTAQIRSVNFWDFPRLSPTQVLSLTPGQIGTINNTEAFAAWSAPARAALTTAQVQSLSVANVSIRLLTATQRNSLTTAQIETVPFYDFVYLTPAQIPKLTNSQIWSIPNTEVLSSWSAAARGALTFAQVQSLSMPLSNLGLLTPTQISWLRPLQVQTVAFYDFPRLSAGQVPRLTAAQIASIPNTTILPAMSAAARAALTAAQVQAIRPSILNLQDLTNQQVGWLTPDQIRGLNFWDFPRLSPAQVALLTPEQIAAINNTDSFAAWSQASRDALGSSQVRAIDTSKVSISLLNGLQIRWLTLIQVRSVPYYDRTWIKVNHRI
jgi:DNA polymerase III psi subunit